jgi:hypothetical protein
MAKRKSHDLFDNLEPPGGGESGRDAATRGALLGGGHGPGSTSDVALHEAAQSRYLNYALSVITSRALPDVRDGLKPVQRRILYTMWERTSPLTRSTGSAQVVGGVMGATTRTATLALRTLVRSATVRAALSARRRLWQFRIARRRQRGGHALHECRLTHQRRDAEIEQSTAFVELRRHQNGARCCRRECPTSS